MVENENYDALFNPGVEKPEAPTGPLDEYRPSAQKGKNNVYQAIIRFVPWWKDPKYGSIKDKWTCWLVDPVTEQGRSIDCPSSIGKPSPLQDMYFKCRNSDNAMLRSKMDIFSRRKTFASLIQVIKDDNNPELEGKILVWKYGVKINEKIESELKPMVGEKHDPFNLLDGKVFALIITKVSGFNNYDQSNFKDKRIPFIMTTSDGKLKPITSNTDQKTVFEYIKENSPDLDKYDYQEWDQETHDYVDKVIVAVTGETNIPSNYAGVRNSVQSGDNVGSKVESAKSGIESQDLDLGELGGDESSLDNLDLPDIDSDSDSDDLGLKGDMDDILKDL